MRIKVVQRKRFFLLVHHNVALTLVSFYVIIYMSHNLYDSGMNENRF